MVNFPQFCLKDQEIFLNFKSCTKTSFITLQVLKGYFGHFKSKRYFDHLEALGALWSFCRFWVGFGYFRSLWLFRSFPSFDGVF